MNAKKPDSTDIDHPHNNNGQTEASNASSKSSNNSKNSGESVGDDATVADSLDKQLEQALEDVSKWKNEFLYLKAEFENYKRNAIKERSELLKFGAERMARDVLEVMDNFERALQIKVSPETIQTFKVGIEMTAKELKEALAKHGITEVPSEGLPFNPAHHEAISSESTAAVPVGHVARVFKKPYKLHEKVIRTGQVVVATASGET